MASKKNKQYWDKLIYSEYEVELHNFLADEYKNGSSKYLNKKFWLNIALDLVIALSVILAFVIANYQSNRGVEATIIGGTVVTIIGLVLIAETFLYLYFTKKWIYEMPENTRKEYIRILKIKYKRYLTLATYAIFWSIIVSFLLIVSIEIFASHYQ